MLPPTPPTIWDLDALLADLSAQEWAQRPVTQTYLRDAIASLRAVTGTVIAVLGTNSAAVVAALALVPATGGTVYFREGLTYSVAPFTVSRAKTTLMLPKGATLSFPVVGASTNAVSVTASDFAVVGKGKVQGPTPTATYVSDERGISMIGASSASRLTGLSVDGVEITGFGSHAIYAQFVDRIRIPDANIHDCGYAGMMYLSCNEGRLGDRVRIETIGPGSVSNMYGVSLTHDSTNYSSDPNAGTQQALNPFCANWVIDGTFINDINWEGIDCHGGYDIAIINNKIYNTKLGISCPSGSGAASNYAGWKNRIEGNTIDGRKVDGTVSGRENTGYAINVNGGSTVRHTGVDVIYNIITAKGTISQSATGVINAQQLRGGLIGGNTLRLWGGIGIQLDNSDGVIVPDNIFQELAAGDTVGRCILYTGTTGSFTFRGNRADANGGTPAKVGIAAVNMTAAAICSDNDFKQCSTAEGLFLTSPPFLRGTDYPNSIIMTVAAAAVDVTPLAGALPITIVVNVSSAPFTLDTITGAKSGQWIAIVNIGSQAVTFSRSSSALLGSAVAVIPTKGTMLLARVGATNYELVRDLTNG